MFPWDQPWAGFCGRVFALIPRQQFAFRVAVAGEKRSAPNDSEPVQHVGLLLPLRDWHRESSLIWVCGGLLVALRRPRSGFLIVSPKFPNHRDSGCDRADKRETDRDYWQHGNFARAIPSTKTVNADV
jgi:hypothetical protein